MPVTKRILTDETGQDIVAALNNLIDAVDPTGSADAANTAAEAANTAATGANNVNITSSKSGKVTTIQTTNRNGVTATTTLTDPTIVATQ